jgi:hypothetical protein
MNETLTPETPLPPVTRIPLTNPAIIAVHTEGCVVDPMIERTGVLLGAIRQPGVTPDAAIALWIRFRELVLKSTKDMRLETEAIARLQKRSRLTIEPHALDAQIPRLATHDPLLLSIGRFRANAFLLSAFATAQAVHRLPTAIMQEVHDAIVSHHAQLNAHWTAMIEAELADYQAREGLIPPGLFRVEVATPTQAAAIVVEH